MGKARGGVVVEGEEVGGVPPSDVAETSMGVVLDVAAEVKCAGSAAR